MPMSLTPSVPYYTTFVLDRRPQSRNTSAMTNLKSEMENINGYTSQCFR
jgi:hypothetical protein